MNIRLFSLIHGHMVGALKLTQPQILCNIHVVWVFCVMNGYNSKQLVPLSVGLNQEAFVTVNQFSVCERHPGFGWFVFLSHRELPHTKRSREHFS